MANGQKKSLKDEAKVSKRHMLTIWAALAAALGSQGIPAIVSMFDNKPDVAAVQQMIANKTAELSVEQNNAVEDIEDLRERIDALNDEILEWYKRRNTHRRPKDKPHAASKSKLKKVPVFNPQMIKQLPIQEPSE